MVTVDPTGEVKTRESEKGDVGVPRRTFHLAQWGEGGLLQGSRGVYGPPIVIHRGKPPTVGKSG